MKLRRRDRLQSGFTLTELMAWFFVTFWFGCLVGVVYVVLHFIMKFW